MQDDKPKELIRTWSWDFHKFMKMRNINICSFYPHNLQIWRMHVVNFLSTQLTNLKPIVYSFSYGRYYFMALKGEDAVLLFFTTQTMASSMSILDIFCFTFFSWPYFITVTSCSWTLFYGFKIHGPLSNSMLNEFSTKIKLLCHF